MKMLPQFNWWTAIVEDRNDPELLGRVRVRILGYHTPNKTTLPTSELPWAIPMMPLTGSSVSGVGDTPAIVTGSTVVGFFADGEDCQQPIIMGTIPGKPSKRQPSSQGFADPFDKYPRNSEEQGEPGYNEFNESDLSRLARSADAETHASLIQKRKDRITEIPVARPPNTFVSAGTEVEPWAEPHARFGHTDVGDYTFPPTPGESSLYPFNHVKETETGHVFEVDDTPGNGRIHEYHNSGTYREIQANGDRVTKIVGTDYEIVVDGKNVAVYGNMNLTVIGDVRMWCTGDMYEEIDGDKFETIRGSRYIKIEGNDVLEIGGDQYNNIAGAHAHRVSGVVNRTYGSGVIENISGNYSVTVSGVEKHTNTSFKNSSAYHCTLGGGLSLNLNTGGKFNAIGSVMSLTGAVSQTITAGGLQTITATASQNIVVTGTQTITAPTRVITGATTHTGGYVVAGVLSGTVVQQGTILLGSHKHLGVTTGPGISGLPTP